jgi:hypothetical protein
MMVALPIHIGSLRPATMKLAVEPVRFDAQAPMKSIITRYMATPVNIVASVLKRKSPVLVYFSYTLASTQLQEKYQALRYGVIVRTGEA